MNSEICGYKLDKNQKDVIFNNANNILVIAGAGCGKTLTIVGKIKYLLNIGYKSDEILCISFTNDSVNSLKNKINKCFSKKINIEVLTFHKLALSILKENNINFNIVDDKLLIYIIDEFFLKYYINNPLLKKMINKYYNVKFLKKIIYRFISNFKSNNFEISDYFTFFNKNNSKINLFLSITLFIYVEYELEKKSQNLYDFDDIIINAKNILKNKFKNFNYIIIDEFQDTSLIRLLLIKKIAQVNNAKLMMVGDDFQSIYKFSGTNIQLFLNLNKYIDNLKIMFLENTYRFSKELAYISSTFILKNKYQFKKNLHSNKINAKPIKLYYYKKYNELDKLVKYIKNDILILGRYNKDIDVFYKTDKNGYIKNNLRYLTVHKSKGLECEEVIIINLKNDILGFPSKLKKEKELSYVTNNDLIKFDEERRLFYVALTRTKNNVYLFVSKKNQSIFVKEIKKKYKKYIEILRL